MGLAATVLGAAMMTATTWQGAASAAPASSIEAQADSDCVRLIQINGYTTLDDRHLLLTGGASRHYLVTTRRSCYGLQSGAQVGLSFANTARICNAQLEYLLIPQGGRCRIQSIEEVEDTLTAQRLIQAREMFSESESR